MTKLKNCISFYLICLLGYTCLFITILWGGYFESNYIQMERQVPESGLEYYYVCIEILIKYYILHFVVLLTSCLILLFEMIFISKKNKNIVPNFLKNINKYVLIIGAILTLLPVYLFILIEILNDISNYRLGH